MTTTTTTTTKALTKAQAIAILTKADTGMTKAELDAMPVAALRALVPIYAGTKADADPLADLAAASGIELDVLRTMPKAAIDALTSKFLTSTGTKGKSADLPKVQLPKVRKVADTDGPLVTRVLTTLAGLKPGTYPLPALVGTDRNGQPKTGTWQPNTTWNVVAETLVDLGFQPVDAKTWADLASTGNVDAQAIVTAFKTPLLEDRKKRVAK